MCHSVHNWPHGYSFTAHPCYGAVVTHPTGMLSCLVGATTPLFIAGTALLVTAGAAGLGGAAADLIISRSKCKEAQAILDRDVELTTELQLLEKVQSKTLNCANVCTLEHKQNILHLKSIDSK